MSRRPGAARRESQRPRLDTSANWSDLLDQQGQGKPRLVKLARSRSAPLKRETACTFDRQAFEPPAPGRPTRRHRCTPRSEAVIRSAGWVREAEAVADATPPTRKVHPVGGRRRLSVTPTWVRFVKRGEELSPPVGVASARLGHRLRPARARREKSSGSTTTSSRTAAGESPMRTA